METSTAPRDSASGSVGGPSGGASRTFQSLFGEPLREDGDDRHATDHRIDTSDRRKPGDAQMGDGDGDVWDDDFPSDSNMESADEDNDGAANEGVGATLTVECRQSMSDWADNDDDEDTWKDALQARVDQLELVVEKKVEPQRQLTAALPVDSYLASPAPSTASTYAPPVDQRATLTLLPKTNLLRSISAPPAADEHKPESKLKTPHVVRSATTTVGTTVVKPKSTTSSGVKQTADSVVDQGQVRKRSNSRDFLSRHALTATDQKRLPKTPPAASASTAASNSVFVRAVVARGNSANGRNVETRITNDGHVDKRAKADDRAAMLALSDAEAVRRHILNDVKKVSIERIVADAKRLQFLEDLHRRQSDHSATSHADSGSTPSSAGLNRSSPIKKRAV